MERARVVRRSSAAIFLDAPNWQALRQQALEGGILDAALNIFMERRRLEAEQSNYWMARWLATIDRGFDALESEIDGVQGFGIGAITYVCVLGYLDFRLREIAWQKGAAEGCGLVCQGGRKAQCKGHGTF